MKRLLLIMIMIFSHLPSYAWVQRAPQPDDQCAVHAPYGVPQTTGVQPICRQGYLVGYDAQAKLPKWVTYTITPEHAIGCVARSNAFAADQSIQGGATPADYAGSNYDKGHMSPDGDQSWDEQVEFESFLMTNMSPQAGSLNRGIWKLLETSVRGWTVQHNQSYTVYVGSLYSSAFGTPKTIGKGVVVPTAFYKIVINKETNEVAGWEFPHVAPYPNLGNDLTKYRVLVSTIMQHAKVVFEFPSNVKELEVGKEWSVDFGALTAAKRQKCGSDSNND
jgi:endonuclease G